MWSSKVHRHLLLCTGRNTSSTGAASASHYDVLGITPKATQAEVKAAYYKLSKLHHPDININNKEDNNGDKFRLITEAYEVLGNYRSRQLYDKGLYGHFRPSETKKHTTPENPKMGFYKSRFDKSRVPTYQMSKGIYNFDEWTRQHYSETFAKLNSNFKRREHDRSTHPREVVANESVLKLAGFAIVAAMVGVSLMNFSVSSNDTPISFKEVPDKSA